MLLERRGEERVVRARVTPVLVHAGATEYPTRADLYQDSKVAVGFIFAGPEGAAGLCGETKEGNRRPAVRTSRVRTVDCRENAGTRTFRDGDYGHESEKEGCGAQQVIGWRRRSS